jgi:hypothetical protein
MASIAYYSTYNQLSYIFITTILYH